MPLRDLSGNEVPRIDAFGVPGNRQPVTNNTPPAFASASVDGAALTITFNGGAGPGLGAVGRRLHGDGGRERGGPCGHQPGVRQRLHGDPDSGLGSDLRTDGDGGLRSAGQQPAARRGHGQEPGARLHRPGRSPTTPRKAASNGRQPESSATPAPDRPGNVTRCRTGAGRRQGFPVRRCPLKERRLGGHRRDPRPGRHAV